MSIDHVAKALGQPATVNGTTRLVLIVLAEAAHVDTDECWPKIDTIRARAGLRQERYVAKALEALGELGLLEVEVHGCPDTRIPENRRPNLYRLTGSMAVAGDARRAGAGAARRAGGARRAAQGVRDAQKKALDSSFLEPEVEPEENRKAVDAVAGAAPEVEDLCEHLAGRVFAHRGGKGLPKVTAAWRRDMRLLVERGPLRIADAQPVPAERVRNAIDFTFERLADPGADGFCWADQIRSPQALRDHWVQLYEAGRRQSAEHRGRNAAMIDPGRTGPSVAELLGGRAAIEATGERAG